MKSRKNDWDDLEEMDEEEIGSHLSGQKRVLATLDSEFRSLRIERKDQVQIVKSLRSALGGLEEVDSGRKSLLQQFHSARKRSQKHKTQRDAVNQSIPPPTEILLEWLHDTHTRLTTVNNDLTSVPMLNRELDAFSRFFEIQAAIKMKRVAEEAHTRYINEVSKLKELSRKLDNNRAAKGEIVSEVNSENEAEGSGISRKEVSNISKRISEIDARLDQLKSEITGTKKDISRVEKYVRISANRQGRVKLSDIRSIAASGGVLSQGEMSALLESGRLAKLDDVDEVEKAPNKIKKTRKKGRKLGVSRAGGRRSKTASRRE
tara:strand:+ start:1517 stop:2473 length:957 start_codon:yes stop_codon:yes gene_type:complete